MKNKEESTLEVGSAIVVKRASVPGRAIGLSDAQVLRTLDDRAQAFGFLAKGRDNSSEVGLATIHEDLDKQGSFLVLLPFTPFDERFDILRDGIMVNSQATISLIVQRHREHYQ